MKANRALAPFPRLSFRAPAFAASALALLALASCSTPRQAPEPRTAPAPRPAAMTPPPKAPTPRADWRVVEVTPGEWRWSVENGQSLARFAGGLVELRCDRAARTVILSRAGAASGDVPVTIATSALERTLSARARPAPSPAVVLTLPATDPLLDAMAFSRGRFALYVAGQEPLYVPSWAEVGKVVEDCRG